jgi:peptidyl-prolyl cis-trans isomerase D
MTMLDRMRRHRQWLKFSLGAVVIAFVVLYIPSFLKPRTSGTGVTDVLADVNGREVLVGTYQRLYRQQVESMRSAYGSNFDEATIRQFIAPRLLQQLIDEQTFLAEADRLGIRVSDAELRERLLRHPGLQENGQFIGSARYEQFLQYQRPPMTTTQFEAELREQLVIEKLQAAISGWVRVADAEVDDEYRRRNEKVRLELAVFTANQFRSGIQPTDAEIAAHFEAQKESFRVPEKRRVRFLSLDANSLRASMTATGPEIESRYRDNAATYSTPEQIRASHILFKTEGKDEAAVRKVAESVLAKVKARGDFAALAKQYTEDEASKAAGGDLDYFGRGRMVKEFEDAAWALSPGQITDLVKTNFGFHIIKLVDKKAAVTKTLADVRPQIEDQIKTEKAQAEAGRLADELANEIKTASDLERIARARGLTIGDSGLFAREEPLMGLGFAPEVASEAFTLAQDGTSGKLKTNQGFAFITLVEIKPSYLPALAEVKDKVRDEVVRVKAVEVARVKAETMAKSAKANFAAAAKAAGVEVKTTDFIQRGSALPEVGVNGAVDDAVFGLKPGETTGPIATDSAVVVARVKERQDVDPTKAVTERDTVRNELLQQRRSQFFMAYMAKARPKLNISYKDASIRALLGGS